MCQKKIKNLILEKNALKKRKDFYDELANLLDFVQFNSYKWGEFVKELVINAKKEGLKVLFLPDQLYLSLKNFIEENIKQMEVYELSHLPQWIKRKLITQNHPLTDR